MLDSSPLELVRQLTTVTKKAMHRISSDVHPLFSFLSKIIWELGTHFRVEPQYKGLK